MIKLTKLLELLIILAIFISTEQYNQSKVKSSSSSSPRNTRRMYQIPVTVSNSRDQPQLTCRKPSKITNGVMLIFVVHKELYLTRRKYHRLEEKCEKSLLTTRRHPSRTRRSLPFSRDKGRFVKYHTSARKIAILITTLWPIPAVISTSETAHVINPHRDSIPSLSPGGWITLKV